MDTGLFGSPVQRELDAADTLQSEQNAALQRSITPKQPISLPDVAIQTGVPVNLLDAIEEQEPGASPDVAARLQEAMSNGQDVQQSLSGLLGDEAASQLVERAYQIADTSYGTPTTEATDEESAWRRFGNAFAQGDAQMITNSQEFARDIGAAVEEGILGRSLHGVQRSLRHKDDGSLTNFGRLFGEADRTPKERAEEIRSTVSPVAAHAESRLAELQESGFAPAHWSDVRGLASGVKFAGENIAMSLPQMATAAVSLPLSILALGGEANSELKERTELSEADRVALATGAGIAMAGLERFGLTKVFGGLRPGQVAAAATSGKLAGTLTRNGMSAAAARTLSAAIAEGTTEVLQEGLVVGITAASGGEYDAAEVADRLAQAFFAGGAAGGGLRAGGEAGKGLLGAAERARPAVADQNREEQAEAVAEEESAAEEAAFEDAERRDEESAPMEQQFPEIKVGDPVTLRDDDGAERDLTFLGEKGGTVRLRMDGREISLAPSEFNSLRVNEAEPDTTDKPKAQDPQMETPKELGEPAGPRDDVPPPIEDPKADTQLPEINTGKYLRDDGETEIRVVPSLKNVDYATRYPAPSKAAIKTASRRNGIKPTFTDAQTWAGLIDRTRTAASTRQQEADQWAAHVANMEAGSAPAFEVPQDQPHKNPVTYANRMLNEANLQVSIALQPVKPFMSPQAFEHLKENLAPADPVQPEPQTGEGDSFAATEGNPEDEFSEVVDVEDSFTAPDGGDGSRVVSGNDILSPDGRNVVADATPTVEPTSDTTVDAGTTVESVRNNTTPTSDAGADGTSRPTGIDTDVSETPSEQAGETPPVSPEMKALRDAMENRKAETEREEKDKDPTGKVPDGLNPLQQYQYANQTIEDGNYSNLIKDDTIPPKAVLQAIVYSLDYKNNKTKKPRLKPAEAAVMLEALGAERPSKDAIQSLLRKHATIGNTQQGKAVNLGRASHVDKAWMLVYLDENGLYPFKGNFRQPTPLFEAWLGDSTASATTGPRVFVNKVGRDGKTDAERGGPLPPEGFTVRDTRKSTDQERVNETPGREFTAIAQRDTPYKVERGFGSTAQEAENDALRKVGGLKTGPKVPTRKEFAKAAAEADPNPTDAQKEAENYKQGHIRWQGLELTIENAKGSERSGTGENGETWSVTMPADYGKFRGTEGADGDHVDFYMGPKPESDVVVIVDQKDPDTGKFDEHKVMLGYPNRLQAQNTYKKGFSDGSGESRIMGMKTMSVEEFKTWLKDGDTKKPASGASTIQGLADFSSTWDEMNDFQREQLLKNIGANARADGSLTSNSRRAATQKWANISSGDQQQIVERALPFLKKNKAAAKEERENLDYVLKLLGEPLLDAMDARHREILGQEPRKSGGDRFIDMMAAGSQLGRYSDAFDPAINKASRQVFAEFSGQKLPRSKRDTIAFLEKGAPFKLTDPTTSKPSAKSAVKSAASGLDEATKGLMELFGGTDTINSGFTFSAETYAKAKPHFQNAIEHFKDAGTDIAKVARALVDHLYNAGMSDGAVENMLPYLERFMQDEVTGASKPDTAEQSFAQFTDAALTRFNEGDGYVNIIQARKHAAEVLGRDVTKDEYKDIEEAIEAAVVQAARAEIAKGNDTDATYDALVDLYQRQPLLAERTSTSLRNQAYSTPAPLAYLSSKLAAITPDSKVYEPSAGTGMLLIDANPANVVANELNPDRVAKLQAAYPEAEVVTGSALEHTPPNFDRLITNPPFGPDPADKTREMPLVKDLTTKELDHAIAYRALNELPEDGRAVLLLGGVMEQGTLDDTGKKYRTGSKRTFYNQLYRQFNVTDHFTVDGDLYKRQGAGFPVDVIVINGRLNEDSPPAEKDFPWNDVPQRYTTWDALKEKLNGNDVLRPPTATTLRSDVEKPGSDVRSVPGETGRSAGEPVATSKSRRNGRVDPATAADGAGSSKNGSGRQAPKQRGSVDRPSGDTTTRNGVSDQGAIGQRAAGSTTDPDANADATVSPAAGSVSRKANSESETALQVRYEPRSNSKFAVGTVMPRNMQMAMKEALSAIEAEHGDIDAFVAGALDYKIGQITGTPDANPLFSAEQVDALAMMIDNVQKGKGAIIGDQTGVGKGRVVAAMLRYAEKQGRVPVFMTKDPGLYADMIRDLRDIGEKSAHKGVLPTNNNLSGSGALALSTRKGDTLSGQTPARTKALMNEIADTGKLPEGFRYLFTTYPQMNTVKGADTDRRRALERLAPNAMLVLDESHLAAGDDASSGRGKKKGKARNTAKFMRDVTQAANGTVFSSATYAKTPNSMTLYATTDLSLAVENTDQLADAVAQGGVPLQQIIAAALVESRQYVRREKSWDGITFNQSVLPTDAKLAGTTSKLLGDIFETDLGILADARSEAIERLQGEGFLNLPNGQSVGIESADSQNFASVLHNVVSQMLMSLKVETTAQNAIAAHNRGEKPVIAVVNTNESILNEVLEQEGASIGDTVDVPFKAILHRYVDRLRRITVKDTDDDTVRYDIPDSALGALAVSELKRLHADIDAADLSAMSAAPLDLLIDKLEAAGLRVGEITGRSKVLKQGVVTSRKNTSAVKKRTMMDFNKGDLDAVLLNQSGSTGFSMHATDKPDNDGKPRRMLVLQPDPNIDTFMQMLGRINRTGQTEMPLYDLIVSDLAVEKRVAAILMKKMASLSANTTAAKDSSVSLEQATDFLNEVGDNVVKEYLSENTDIAMRLNISPGEMDVARKVTGRLAIMSPADTALVYDDIETAYKDRIAALDAVGENPLEAKTVDLQAKTKATTVLRKGKNPASPFGADTVVEEISAKVLAKPYKWSEVQKRVKAGKKVLDKSPVTEAIKAAETFAIQKLKANEDKLKKRLDAAEQKKDTAPKGFDVAKLALTANDKRKNELQSMTASVESRMRDMQVGQPVVMTIGGIETVGAIITEVDVSRLNDNPLAMGKYRITFALADARRSITLPLSQINPDAGYEIAAAKQEDVQGAFESASKIVREDRFMATGNIVGALTDLGRGRVMFYTNDKGEVRPGVLMPQGFDLDYAIKAMPVKFRKIADIERFMKGHDRQIEMMGGAFTVSTRSDGHWELEGNGKARSITTDPKVTKITGEWRARGTSRLSKTVPPDVGAKVVSSLMRQGYEPTTTTDQSIARAITGQEIDETTRQARIPTAQTRQNAPGTLTFARIQSLTKRMNDMALPPDVALHVTRQLFGTGPYGEDIVIAGQYARGVVMVGMNTPGSMSVLDHETIHALRDEKLWGRKYGLFSAQEWQALVKNAKVDSARLSQIKSEYPDYSHAQKIEEVIAGQFVDYMRGRGAETGVMGIFAKVRTFFRHLNAALRGQTPPSVVFERIAAGQIGERAPASSEATSVAAQSRFMRGDPEDLINTSKSKWQRARQHISSALQTNLGDGQFSALSLIPGRPLFKEIASKIPAANRYLHLKEKLDADRNDLQARGSSLIDKWRALNKKDPDAGERLMELMHKSTASGIDPTDRQWGKSANVNALNAGARRSAGEIMNLWNSLPVAFQKLYVRTRDYYKKQADDFEAELVRQVSKSIDIATKKARREMDRELKKIRHSGMTRGEQKKAADEARSKYGAARHRAEAGRETRIRALREQFEKNRIKGPYFPLQRFGDFFVTVRDSDGEVYSFDKFETQIAQEDFYAALEADPAFTDKSITKGRMTDTGAAQGMVDPRFVAEIQGILQDTLEPGDQQENAADAIWQQFLMTLPTASVRTNRIHRKGTEGWFQDAARTLAHHAFHGAHQLSKLRYGLDMQDALNDANEQVRDSGQSEKLAPIYNEMRKRHEFTMNPTSHKIATAATSAAFVWYLSVTPAAALINLSQTVMLGVPIMNARYSKASVGSVAKELAKAAKDFMPADLKQQSRKGLGQDNKVSVGRTWSIRTKNLQQEEQAALREAYRMGVIDKSQAHELASVADSGVEYNSAREKAMRTVSYLFHHTERMNREVTFMASYRLGIKDGLEPKAAIRKAADVTWDTHFSYQNTDRPRVSQGDFMKVILTFRSHTINMIYRLARDAHQSLNGENEQVRTEARKQLVGIYTSMALGAGITGVPLFNLLMTAMAMIPGGADDDEELAATLVDWALVDSDSGGAAVWNYGVGMAAKGVPGHVLGIELSERIGMPNLWFRGARSGDDAEEVYASYIKEIMGPAVGIVASAASGLASMNEGDVRKGLERMVPKFARDVLRAERYAREGVTTRRGDPILEDLDAGQIFAQAIGFTPAQVAERYRHNSMLYARQLKIKKARTKVMKSAVDSLRQGKGLTDADLKRISDFNDKHPTYPVTADSIRRSYRARIQASQRSQGGAALHPRLDGALRSTAPQTIYN